MVECSDRRVQLGFATIPSNNSLHVSKDLNFK